MNMIFLTLIFLSQAAFSDQKCTLKILDDEQLSEVNKCLDTLSNSYGPNIKFLADKTGNIYGFESSENKVQVYTMSHSVEVPTGPKTCNTKSSDIYSLITTKNTPIQTVSGGELVHSTNEIELFKTCLGTSRQYNAGHCAEQIQKELMSIMVQIQKLGLEHQFGNGGIRAREKGGSKSSIPGIR